MLDSSLRMRNRWRLELNKGHLFSNGQLEKGYHSKCGRIFSPEMKSRGFMRPQENDP
jgi:hypothetical protein